MSFLFFWTIFCREFTTCTKKSPQTIKYTYYHQNSIIGAEDYPFFFLFGGWGWEWLKEGKRKVNRNNISMVNLLNKFSLASVWKGTDQSAKKGEGTPTKVVCLMTPSTLTFISTTQNNWQEWHQHIISKSEQTSPAMYQKPYP